MNDDPSAHGILAGLFARGEAADELSDRALLRAMLDVEVALMRAVAGAGMAPAVAAEELAGAAGDAASFDLEEIGRSAGEKGTPVPGLLSALRARLSGAAAEHLHRGATSQDVLDTALMLVAARALHPTLRDLEQAAAACASLAERHRRTVAPGRTLLQQAVPITFGLKAANWLSALDAARAELARARDRALAVQLGGAVGTLAAFGERGPEIAADLADQLGLAASELPWHTARARPARLACALGVSLGTMGKVARDVALLAQTEVAEAVERGEPGRGGSSTMAHKRNPVGAVAVIACAQRSPGLVATMLSAMLQEHERAAGAWQAEWETLLELLRLTGSAAASLGEVLECLEVDPDRMRANLGATSGLVMSESVATTLADPLGWPEAQRIVEYAVERVVHERLTLRDVLLEIPEVAESVTAAALDEALDPERYLGATDSLIDRALATHRTTVQLPDPEGDL
jgi:3-carboxy-cis,cis-muconate cycloisomerase